MNQLFDEVDVLETAGDSISIEVTGIEHDSRHVGPGDLFVCLPGAVTDGHLFAPEAATRGAVGLVCERFVADGVSPQLFQARVAPGQARPALAALATRLYGRPSSALTVAGVTGTNGKTTVAHLLGAVLDHAGVRTAVLGTLSGERTTPEADELQRTLAQVRDEQLRTGERRAVTMEVSSHALTQSRVDGVAFAVAVFTNLSHDHLEYHGTMEAYFAAKASLFTPEHAAAGVVNADDPWGARLLETATIPIHSVYRSDASNVSLSLGSSSFTWRGVRVSTVLTGTANVENALLAAEAAVAVGVDPDTAAAGLGHAPVVPGRFEVVASPATTGTPFSVMVDYAHTPAGLETVLREARTLGHGRVLVVFGCGGNRDRAKRPLMGEVATRLTERAFLTSDNPRDEDPGAIVAEVLTGTKPGAIDDGSLVVILDRRSAIDAALAAAETGDLVVVAGKGHETYQEIAGERFPFDDRQVVRSLLGIGAR